MDEEEDDDLGAGRGEEGGSGAGEMTPFQPARAAKPCRPRHDGFTPEKQKKFFKALRKTGCITDACRACGISRNTIRRWRDRWAAFDEKVDAALAIASGELDMIAWKRATEGAEEKVYRDGKLVFTRVKPSDAMLRLLMQGANPKKYGRTGQMPKKAVMKALRREVEAELRAGLRSSEEELNESILKKLDVLDRRLKAKRDGAGPDRAGSLAQPGRP